MIRILVVDDEDVRNTIVRELEVQVPGNFEGVKAEVEWVPVDTDDSAVLREILATKALEHWDALLVDVNLYPDKGDMPPLLVPCQLVEEFGKYIQAAIVFIYSGLIE